MPYTAFLNVKFSEFTEVREMLYDRHVYKMYELSLLLNN